MSSFLPSLHNAYGQYLAQAVSKSEFTQAIVDSMNARSLQRQETEPGDPYRTKDGKQLWRSQDDLDRFTLYSLFADLYKGAHEQWLRPNWLPSGKIEYRTYNLPRFISTTYADLTMGGGVEIDTGREEIDHYYNEDLKIFRLLYHWFILSSIYGIAAIQVMETEEGADFVELKPDIIYPQFKEGGFNEFDWISKKIVIDPERLDIPEESGWRLNPEIANAVVYEERHYEGAIEYYLYSVKDNEIAEQLPVHWYDKELPPYEQDPEDEERWVSRKETGVDEFLIILIPCSIFEDTFVSDYQDIASIVRDINARMTHIGRILNIHANPKLLLPDSFNQRDPRTGEPIMRGLRDEVLFISPEDQYFEPKYLTWDAQLEHAYKEVEQLISMLLTIADISPELIVRQDSQFPDSAAALKLKLTPTLNRVSRKQMFFTPAIQKFIYVHAQFLIKKGKWITSGVPQDTIHDVSTEDHGDTLESMSEADVDNAIIDQRHINVRYKPALPQDDQLMLDRYGAGQSISLPRLLTDVDDMTEKEVMEEIAKIKQDGQDGLGDTPLGAAPGTGGFFGAEQPGVNPIDPNTVPTTTAAIDILA